MALIVEDGTGKLDAESYVSVADAGTYFAKFGTPAAWTAATTEAKEQALRAATQYLDSVYGLRFEGSKLTAGQSLRWPRYGVESDGIYLVQSAIPQALKDAAAEMALRHITETDGLIPDIAEPGDVQSESVSVGSIQTSTTYVAGKSPVKRFRKVDLILSGLVSGGGRMERA